MTTRLFRTALILGLISAIGPFAIDMYLPSLPSIGASLGASPASVQFTLTAFFVSLGLGQLVYGPAADIFGRKLPIYFGMTLFTLASIGCALSTDIGMLIGFRFLEGLGGCAGMVVPRAIVRDLHTGEQATRLMSMLMLVFSISPILAPLAGSFIIQWLNWRFVFWFVMLAALAGLGLLATQLKETRPHHERANSTVRAALTGYGQLLKDRHFLGLTFTSGFGMASFFSYLSSSSFVFIGHYHYSPRAYGLFFGVNALAFFAAAQCNGALIARFGMVRVVLSAVSGFAATMLVLLGVFMSGVDQALVLAGGLFIGFGFLGMVIPTTSVLAMDAQGHRAGTAAALLGTLQFATGSSVMALIAPFTNGQPLPMIAAIAAVAVIAWALAFSTLGRALALPSA